MKSLWESSTGRDFSITMELAFWTMWISRWAKEYQSKSYETRNMKYRFKCNERAEELYELKNKANYQLSLSRYAELSFYEGDNPDKFNLYLCQNHYDDWLKEREFRYLALLDYYSEKKTEIEVCENCLCETIYNYYSLYYINYTSLK